MHGNPPPTRGWFDRLRHDRRVLLMAFLAAMPGVVVSLTLLWTGDFSPKVQWTLTVFIAIFYLGFSFALRDRVVLPLQTLSNLLAALREGDFSIRARSVRGDDPLGEVMVEVNALVETLRYQRLGALEATALLQRVMSTTDVAIFAFDADQRVQLVNRAGERLLGQAAGRLLGRRAAEIGLESCCRTMHPGSSTPRFRAGRGAGRSGGARSVKADGRIVCSCSPMSASRFAKRNGRPGSA